LKLILRLLICFTLIAMMISAVNAQLPTLLWSDPVDTLDIALSKDGRYVVSAVYDSVGDSLQVRFHGRSSGTPIWTYSAERALTWIVTLFSQPHVFVESRGFGKVYLLYGKPSLQ